jgi:hypothetical protein
MEEYRALIEEAGASRSGLRKLRDLSDPVVCEILNYWFAKRGDRRMPSPGDMDPVDFARYMPNLMMLQVDYEPFRLTYRLIGEKVAITHGANLKGRSVLDVNEHTPKLGTMLFELYKAVAELRRPVGVGGQLNFAGLGLMDFEGAYMPLSLDGERTDRIFTVTRYFEMPIARRIESEMSAV